MTRKKRPGPQGFLDGHTTEVLHTPESTRALKQLRRLYPDKTASELGREAFVEKAEREVKS